MQITKSIHQTLLAGTLVAASAAIALAEFNSIFPNDPRFQETTLLIAESAVNFAPKDQLCDILKQSLEFMVNPSVKFVKRINNLKIEKQCTAE